jgi:hypothetical protein
MGYLIDKSHAKYIKISVSGLADKSAIILTGRLLVAMGNIFVTMTKLLPVRYKVFSDIKEAEAFLCSIDDPVQGPF